MPTKKYVLKAPKAKPKTKAKSKPKIGRGFISSTLKTTGNLIAAPYTQGRYIFNQ